MNYITFDIETYSPSGLNKIDTNEFQVSVIGAYISWIDKYLVFFEDQAKDFIELMKQADLVIGYNHLWFDLPVLQKYARRYSNFDLLSLPTYDIMLEIEKKIGFKPRLNDISKATFNDLQKTDSFENFRNYHLQNKWAELTDYCMHDVLITETIFRRIRDGQKLFFFDLHQKKDFVLDKPVPGQKVQLAPQTESIF